MKQKLKFLTLLFFGIYASVYSQDFMTIADSMRGSKFSEITNYLDQLYEGKDTIKGSGWKPYQRWKHEQSLNLDPEGYMVNHTRKNWDITYSSGSKSATLKSSSDFRGNWNSFGTKTFKSLDGSDGGNGRVNCIVADPDDSNILYAGTPAGGLWRSVDAGENWVPLTDGMPNIGISGIVIDPSSPANNRTIYVLSGDGDGGHTYSLGVFKSVDHGASWYLTELEWDDNQEVRSWKLVLKPGTSDVMFSATDQGIHKITNGGLSLAHFLTDKEIVDIEFNTENPEIMYASSFYGEVFRSTTGGDNWEQLDDNGLPVTTTWDRVALAVTPDDPDYLYAFYGKMEPNNEFTGMYLSTDGGNSFTRQSYSPNIAGDQSFFDLAIAVSPTDKNTVYAGGVYLWISQDAGVTWTKKMTSDKITRWGTNKDIHSDIHALEYINDILYCGNDGGIFFLDNTTDLWHDISSTLEITQLYKIGDDPIQPDVVHGGAQDNGSNILQGDTIYHWGGGDGFEVFAHPTNPNIIYGSWQHGRLHKTEDGGLSTVAINHDEEGTGLFNSPFIMDPNDSETLYAGCRNLFKSTNGGSSWESITGSITDNIALCKAIAVAPSNSQIIFLSKGNKLYKTTDGGITWDPVLSGYIEYIFVHPYDEDKIWAVTSSKVYKTTNGGSGWSDITSNLPGYTINCITYQKGSNDGVYVGTSGGVFYTDNTTYGWVGFNDGLVKIEIKELEINYASAKLRAATFGRGVWESDLYYNCEDESVITIGQAKGSSIKTANETIFNIEAESFANTGGSYNDSYAGGVGYGVNRTAEGINYVNRYDWAVYNLPSDFEVGIYAITYYIGSASNNSAITMSIDNGPVRTMKTVPNNGECENYAPLSAGQITINNVNSTLKIATEGSTEWQWCLDKIVLRKTGNVEVPIEEIQLDPTELTLIEGDTKSISATIFPEYATNTTLKWSTESSSIATVTQEGVVKGINAGNTTITAKSEDGSVSATCYVTVDELYTITLQAENRFAPVSSPEIEDYYTSTGLASKVYANNRIYFELPAHYRSGLYKIDYYIATEKDNIQIHQLQDFRISNQDFIDDIPNTGGWEDFEQVTSSNYINLDSDNERALMVQALCDDGKAFHIDKIVLTRIGDLDIHPYGIDIYDDSFNIGPGKSKFINYTIIPHNASNKDVQWSADPSIIRLDTSYGDVCYAYYQGAGETMVTVTTKDGGFKDSIQATSYSGYIDVTGIEFENPGSEVGLGGTLHLGATVIPENATDKRVRWSAYPTSVASVDPNGIVTGHQLGTSRIRAFTEDEYHTYMAERYIEVKDIPVTSITLSHSSLTIDKSETFSLTAALVPGNANGITWSSNDESVAIVDQSGNIEGMSAGSAIITATSADGLISANCIVTVEQPYTITVQAESGNAIFGSYETYTVNGVTAIKVNTGQLISYMLPSYYQAGRYKVDYYIATAVDGAEIEISGMLSTSTFIDQIPNNGDWDGFVKVTSPKIVSLSSSTDRGLYVMPMGPTPKAWHLDKIVFTRVDDYYVPVEEITISANPAYVEVGGRISVRATIKPQAASDNTVNWSVGDESIASIDTYGTTCFIDGLALGQTTISATSADGMVIKTVDLNVIEEFIPVSSIEISPTNASVIEGNSIAFSANVLPENATCQDIVWTTSTGSYATISANGLAVGIEPGTISIRASVNDNGFTRTSSTPLEVLEIPVESVTVDPTALSLILEVKVTDTIEATVLPEDAGNKTVLWSTNNPDVATVDANGIVSAVSEGIAAITATTQDGGYYATTMVTVIDPNIITIEAEEFTSTGGITNDAPWGGPGYGVNRELTNIDWVNTHDWVEYPLAVYVNGKFEVDYLISTPVNGAAIELSIDSIPCIADDVPNNGEWNNFMPLTAGKLLQFEPGNYTLKVKGVGTNGWEWNLDKIVLRKAGEACYEIPNLALKAANELTGFYKGKMEGVVYESEELEDADISEANKNFSIYPNPTSSQFTISFNVESNQPTTIQIRNILGELQAVVVDSEILEKGKYEMNYGVHNLVSGMYLITFKNGTTNEVKTLIIE